MRSSLPARGAALSMALAWVALGGPAAASAVEEAPHSQEIDLQSGTLTVEHKRQRAVFGDGVVVRRGDLEVRCPTLIAHYDHASRIREVVCEGPVTATQGGRTMTSQAGRFDNTTGLLRLEGETTLVEADRRFTGSSLTFETGTNLATLLQGQAELPSGDPLLAGQDPSLGTGPFRIRADEVRHEFTDGKTTFDGNVVANRADVVVRASRLILLGVGSGAVERAWTEGGSVEVEQGERSGVSDRAWFSGDGRRLILEGNPRVTEGDSILRGEKVTFWLGEGRVEVIRPRAVFPLGEARRRMR